MIRNSAETSKQSASGEATSLFISYSRRDKAFVDSLVTAFEAKSDSEGASKFRILIDKDDRRPKAEQHRDSIYVFDDWWKRLKEMIAQSDVVVFVISPDSVGSPVCQEEIDYATSLNKKLAPIVCRETQIETIPEELRQIDWVSFTDEKRFEYSLERLMEGLSIDIDWIREHTRIGTLGAEWAERGEEASLLLRSDALNRAELWIAAHPSHAPEPNNAADTFYSNQS